MSADHLFEQIFFFLQVGMLFDNLLKSPAVLGEWTLTLFSLLLSGKLFRNYNKTYNIITYKTYFQN